MKACIKYLIGLAILGLAGLVNASPMPEADFNEHEFDLLNITLPQTNMSGKLLHPFPPTSQQKLTHP
jgi:hypothetical protein